MLLCLLKQYPGRTIFMIIMGIVAWPFVMERWNDWRREQFLRKNPSVIIVPKSSKRDDLWPTRLFKLIGSNVKKYAMICCHVLLGLTVTFLRLLTQYFTMKTPAQAKPQISTTATESKQKSITSPVPAIANLNNVTSNPPPTSVLKRRNPGERKRRDSIEQRVSFTESSNGNVVTSYYYYNPSMQANQKSAILHETALQNHTPVPVRYSTSSRLPTPYHLAKQQQRPSHPDHKEEKKNLLLESGKENSIPPLLTHKSHSPGQRQIRAAMGPVTVALRKRRIELENITHGSEAKRRIPVGGTRSSSSMIAHPKKRRERHQLIWEQLNKRPKNGENVSDKRNLTICEQTNDKAAPLDSTPSTFQFGSNTNVNSSTPLENTRDAFTHSKDVVSSTIAPPFEPTRNTITPTTTTAISFTTTEIEPNSSKGNTSSTTSGFSFGSSSSTNGPTESSSTATSALNPVQEKMSSVPSNPAFQFGSTITPSSDTQTLAATANFQFNDLNSAQTPLRQKTPEVSANTGFSFGATNGANAPPVEVLNVAPQPAFKFGSSAENTPPPGKVSNGQPSFQFGGDNGTTTPTFGASNPSPSFGAPSSTEPSFGATAAPVFGMGSPSVGTNSARARRLARRGRK